MLRCAPPAVTSLTPAERVRGEMVLPILIRKPGIEDLASTRSHKIIPARLIDDDDAARAMARQFSFARRYGRLPNASGLVTRAGFPSRNASAFSMLCG